MTMAVPGTACGVDFVLRVDYGIDARQIVIEEISVKLDGQTLNTVLCEDAQQELENGVVAYLQEEHPDLVVIVGKHIDEVL